MFQNLDIKVPNAKMANFKGEHEGTRPPTACAVSTCFNAYLSDFQVSFTHLVSLLFWLIILQLYTYTHTQAAQKLQFLHVWRQVHIRTRSHDRSH